MAREVIIGNKTILVIDRDGVAHIADVSDIVNRGVDPASIRPALQAYFEKYGLRFASPDEMERHGFPQRRQRLDRNITLPKRRDFR